MLAVLLSPAPVSAQDYLIVPQAGLEDCWDQVPLGERYALTDENGDLILYEGSIDVLVGVIVRECNLHVGELDDYLSDKLPEVARGFNLDIAEAIEIVQDVVVAERCPLVDYLPACQDGSAFLTNSILTGKTTEGVPGDDDVLSVAWLIIVDHQNRQSAGSSPYVFKPSFPKPGGDPGYTAPSSPRRPPQPPANVEWHNGGLSDGTTTDKDQYSYGDDGYHRRKQQADGTWRCYYNGYDGSLDNLGTC